jgi:hypothetical protein
MISFETVNYAQSFPIERFCIALIVELKFLVLHTTLNSRFILGDSVTGLYSNHKIVKEGSNLMKFSEIVEQLGLHIF